MKKSSDLAPTSTLAKMFENQGNYKQALEIYVKLQKKNPDEFFQKKINYLGDLVRTKNRKSHDEVESYILTHPEKNVFEIDDKKYSTPKKINREKMISLKFFRKQAWEICSVIDFLSRQLNKLPTLSLLSLVRNAD